MDKITRMKELSQVLPGSREKPTIGTAGRL